MLLYVILIFTVLYLILKAFIKIKFHFWSIQPVFHIYDIQHWLRPNRVICNQLPEINKFVNIVDIKTKNLDEMSKQEITSFCTFIRENYLRNKDAEYAPEESHIMECMKGVNHPSYISIHYRPAFPIDSTTNPEINLNTDIYSVISARIVHITLKNVSSFPLYYIDNLCVNPAMRKKGIAPKAIQTLHYHLRRKNEHVRTFLFKREGEMTAIVPLTTFTTYGYHANHIQRVELPHASMKLVEVTSKNLSLFVDHLQRKREIYDCIIVPEVANIYNMVNSGVITMYGILQNGKLCAVYVFRDAATYYDGERAVELVCSISTCHFDEIFYDGFTQALALCCQEWKATKVIIDGVGDNQKIINNLFHQTSAHFLSSPSAYFLYNYASYTYPPDKCFLFC